VEGVLQQELGYTEEMSVLTDEGVIYDPELEDNLPKKLSELGIKSDSSLIIKDEDDEEKDPRVDLEFRVVERIEPLEDSKPVTLVEPLDIPRRSRKVEPEPDLPSVMNGTSTTGKRKREGEDEPLTNGHVAKKVAGESTQNGNEGAVVIDDAEGIAKEVAGESAQKVDEDVVVIDDDEGAILIDD
jgi:ubiquitin-like 1-activating enzyme E1 B